MLSDSHNRRFAILDKAGKVVREFPQGEAGFPPFDACLDDGTVVLQRSLPVAQAFRPTRLNRIALDGALVNQVGEFPYRSFDMITQSEASTIGWQDRIYSGDGTTSEVRVYTPAGRLTMIIRTADPVVRITDAEAEERMRSTIPRGTSGTEVSARLERMRSTPRATTWPAYRRLHVDPNGTLWVQDYARKYPAPDAWTAFDRDGRLIGRLVIPAPKAGERRLEIIRFESDGLLVRRTDDDGFAHLTVFPIQRITR